MLKKGIKPFDTLSNESGIVLSELILTTTCCPHCRGHAVRFLHLMQVECGDEDCQICYDTKEDEALAEYCKREKEINWQAGQGIS